MGSRQLCEYREEEHDDPEMLEIIEGHMACASHILATVREDDDEPVTDVWWRTLPKAWFADLDGEERLCLVVHDDIDEDPDNRAMLVLADDGSWGFWEQDRKTNELHSPHHNSFRLMNTRGDVRRLCSALGIQLTATP